MLKNSLHRLIGVELEIKKVPVNGTSGATRRDLTHETKSYLYLSLN